MGGGGGGEGEGGVRIDPDLSSLGIDIAIDINDGKFI